MNCEPRHIRLRKRPELTPERYQSRILPIDARLQKLATWQDAGGAALYADATAALRTYIQTGALPPLPQKSVADG